jgi:hypothetical protein
MKTNVEELAMAKQRSSFAKLQRDKAKKERAAIKRANRLQRKSADESETETEDSADVVSMVTGEGEPSPEELLQMVEDLHNRREAGLISQEDFEEAKVELFARLQID